MSIGYGSSLAWTGPNFLTLTSNDTVLSSGPLSTYEGSLVVSLPFLVATIGILVYTLALDRIGRKSLFASLAILQIVSVILSVECTFLISPKIFPFQLSWLTLLFASNVYHLYVGRLGNILFCTILIEFGYFNFSHFSQPWALLVAVS